MSTPVADLIAIVQLLRGPEGCPWDRAQTPESMRPYLVEETYEVLDAIESGDEQALCGELGDLLFQIVMLAEMARQRDAFDMDEVARGIHRKMVERHPHVFDPDHQEEDPGSVGAWEARKAATRGPDTSMLDGIPTALPALVRAHRVGEKVSRVGFDWPDLEGVRAKVDEEMGELDEALAEEDAAAVRAEYGDLLLSVANMGRFLGIGPEEALREANARFDGRFRMVEELARSRAKSLLELEPAALEALWQEAKKRV